MSNDDVQAIAARMLAVSNTYPGLRQRTDVRQREIRFQRDVNHLVDTVYLHHCRGDMRETAIMLCAALISTLRGLPRPSDREVIAKMLHTALYMACEEVV